MLGKAYEISVVMETAAKDAKELQSSSRYKKMNKVIKEKKDVQIKLNVSRSLTTHATDVQKAIMFEVNAIFLEADMSLWTRHQRKWST